jgi:hypothetical protein
MPRSQEQRPRFFEGQYLGADDLTAAVAYNRLQNARHALGAHTWGIASGLQLKETSLPDGKVDVYVMPGYAWDGFGRPVVVLAPYKIPAELFRSYVYDQALDNGTPAGRLIEVWLRYDETATQNVRPGFEVCDVADQRSRVQETFRVEVGARPGHLDRHDRIAVAGNVVDAQEAVQTLDPQTPPVAIYDESIPYQNFPAEGERAYWLLPLGMARWLPNSNPNQPGNFVPRNAQDLAKSRSLRRYIGVVAESVQAAEGILRLRDRTKDYSQVQSNDLVWVEGSLRVEGDVRLFGGRLDFRYLDGQDFAVPLHIRRTGDPGPGARALQISLGPDTQSNNSLAVGPLKMDNTLDEKFVVLSGGNVGIGTSTPALTLDIRGDFGRTDGAATAHLWASEIGDRGGGILFLRSGGGVVTFDGNDNVGIGTTTPVSKLEVAGDVALEKAAPGTARVLPADATMFWNDGTWLRLNQNLDYTKPIFGVHTPGLFASGSLNVGGAGGWGDPSPGNVWVTGNVGIGTTTPLERLDVRGHVRLHTDGSLFAPGGVENLRIVRGTVQSNGTIAAGSGFSVSPIESGLYEITFNQSFSARPSASVTQVFPDLDDFGTGGDTRDNAVLVGINANRIRVKTGDSDGGARNRDFTFVVIGPR